MIKQTFLVVALQLVLINWVSAQNVKVAFIGDQGTDENAQAVLQLIAAENTELLLIQGDLGYEQNTALIWEDNLNQILGANFPVLVTIGNHENFEWPKYKNFAKDRINRIPELSCEGDIGVKAFCRYKGIEVVQVAQSISEVPGVLPNDEYDAYIRSTFKMSKAQWRVCSWHKNQAKMQVGNQPDHTGWGVYQACLNSGGLVATAHEHSYSRTFLMSSFENQSVKHRNNRMEIRRGESIAFVSGMGGRPIRPQRRYDDWWAAVATSTQSAAHGALFCDFAQGEANCYFKGVDGIVYDQFTLVSRLENDDFARTIIAALASIVRSLFD